MIYHSKYDLIEINNAALQFGGLLLYDNNVLHLEALDYLVDIVGTSMFGEELYPTISRKAAVYMFNIICNHIFHDGNKRTGLQAALIFLEKNGFALIDEVTAAQLTDFALYAAGCELRGVNLDFIEEWFSLRISPVSR